MTNDPTVTTLTRWAVRPKNRGVAWNEIGNRTYRTEMLALAIADSDDRDWPQLAPHRVVRVDVTITDPAPAEEKTPWNQ